LSPIGLRETDSLHGLNSGRPLAALLRLIQHPAHLRIMRLSFDPGQFSPDLGGHSLGVVLRNFEQSAIGLAYLHRLSFDAGDKDRRFTGR